MLSLNNVTSYYGKTPILQNIDLDVRDGECVCVLGRNGVGKTTLMQSIMGLTTKVTGEIRINGQPMAKAITAKRAIAGLGYVPQGRRIFGKFTVRENIRLGTFAREDGKDEIPELCLELFPYLADNLDKRAGMLSGGQQQQLAIARALATDPKILLLDEPTEGIQPNVVTDIQSALVRLNKEFGVTLLLTEQHIKIAKAMSDSFIIMDVGRIVARGDTKDLTSEIVDKHLTI
jgi:urea transport system ATP-binding protein